MLLAPFIPETAQKIFNQLRIEGSPANLSLTPWGGLAAGHVVGSPEPLFPRKDLVKKP